MKVLIVAAIVCSACILAVCDGARKQGVYEPGSESCLIIKKENAKPLRRCSEFNFWFWDHVCEYACSKSGSFDKSHCYNTFFSSNEIPKCDDLICVSNESDGSNEDLFEPESKSCLEMKRQSDKDIKSCLKSKVFVCSYSCSKSGSLNTQHCSVHFPFPNNDAPKCKDLICILKESGSDKPTSAKPDDPEPKEQPEPLPTTAEAKQPSTAEPDEPEPKVQPDPEPKKTKPANPKSKKGKKSKPPSDKDAE